MVFDLLPKNNRDYNRDVIFTTSEQNISETVAPARKTHEGFSVEDFPIYNFVPAYFFVPTTVMKILSENYDEYNFFGLPNEISRKLSILRGKLFGAFP